MRLARRWRLLLAHDATATTCDPLLDSIEDALGNVDVYQAPSVDDARDVLRSSAAETDAPRFDVAMICLDLPPAPTGGVRLAAEMRRDGLPVVLITRSLRWIPPSANALRELPWVTPDAGAGDVARAIGEAVASMGVAADESWPAAGRASGGEFG
jgi:hypothetical protein